MPRIRYVAVEGPPRNPLLQFLGFVAGLGLLAVSFVFGAFLIAALVGVGLIVGIAVYARLWWLQRRMARTGKGKGEGDYIETEYTVVERHPTDDRQP
jgi:hypothetical protein